MNETKKTLFSVMRIAYFVGVGSIVFLAIWLFFLVLSLANPGSPQGSILDMFKWILSFHTISAILFTTGVFTLIVGIFFEDFKKQYLNIFEV